MATACTHAVEKRAVKSNLVIILPGLLEETGDKLSATVPLVVKILRNQMAVHHVLCAVASATSSLPFSLAFCATFG